MKKLLLLFISIITALSLCACQIGGDSDGSGDQSGSGSSDTGNQGGSTGGTSAGAVWSPSLDTVIVTDEAGAKYSPLKNHISTLTGKSVSVIGPNSEKTYNNEVILGRADRSVSDAAYRRLNRYADPNTLVDRGESAFLIYAENGSLAIAYSDLYARDAAVEYITANIKSQTLCADGTLYRESFKTLDFVNDKNAEKREAGFEALEAELGVAATDALRGLYSLYTSDLYTWLANLYDPDIGGFYYSESARNTEGYLPDIESTGQALGLIDRSGLSSAFDKDNNSKDETNWEEMLSEKTKEQLLAFTLSLRAEDGFYYHPQWGTSIGSSRKGRDQGWGNDIIRALGYGHILDKDYVPEDSGNITVSFRAGTRGSVISAISRVTSSSVVAVAGDFESAIKSEKAFISWLDEQDLSSNSYNAGNTINANISRINNAGLRPVLQEYLREHQYENGLWEPEVTYQSINGLMKISTSCFYSGAFPNADKAIESVVEVMGLPMSDELASITFVYNQFESINKLLSSCTMEKKEAVEEMLLENSAEIFRNTLDKLRVFRKEDGGFSMNQETSAPNSQNVPVAIPGSAESDVNATAIGISTLFKDLFLLYDLENSEFPKLFYEHDGYYFLDCLDGLGTIIKSVEVYEDPPVITFDDYDPKDGNEASGVVKYPANGVTNWPGSDILDSNGNYKYFASAVVDNPKPSGEVDPLNPDKVLYATDYIHKDADGNTEKADDGSNTVFLIQNSAMNGNCYVVDMDILFGGGDNLSDCLAQLQFFTSGTDFIAGWLNVYAYEDKGVTYLRIAENFAGADGYTDKEVVKGLPIDEWFNLRLEFYKVYDETGALFYKFKIYVDGEYAGYSDSSNYDSKKGEYMERNITAFRFSYYRHSSSAWYFNNAYVAEADTPYVQENLGGGEELVPESDRLVHDFESGIADSADFKTELVYKDSSGNINYISGGEWTRALEIVHGIGVTDTSKKAGVKIYNSTDPTNKDNKVIKVYTFNVDNSKYNASMTVDDSILSAKGQTWELAFDYFFADFPWIFNGTYTTVDFKTVDGHKVTGLTFEATDWQDTNSTKTMRIRRDDGSYVGDFTMKSNTWYSFRIEYFYNTEDFTRSRMRIYLVDKNGADVCISDTRASLKAGEISEAVFGFSAYKIRGLEYFDDISFARTDKKYTSSTVYKGDKVKLPETPPRIVGSDFYDFSEDVTSGVAAYGYNTYKEAANREEYFSDSITSTVPTYVYGSAFTIATKSDGAPVKAGEQVLKVSSRNTVGGMLSTLTLSNPDSGASGMMHIVEYDYYFESNAAAKNATVLFLRFNSSMGDSILNLTAAKNVVEHSGGYKRNVVQIGGNADSRELLSAGRWYRIRIVWDRTADGGGRYYYYYSENGGKSYNLALVAETDENVEGNTKNSKTPIDSVSFVFNGYNNSAVQYFDNMSYVVAKKLPEYVAPELPDTDGEDDLYGGIVDGYWDEKRREQ